MKQGLVIICLALTLGLLGGKYAGHGWQFIKEFVAGNGYIYTSQNPQLVARSKASEMVSVGWNDLLPEDEKSILTKYQQVGPTDPEEQILRSIQASKDQAYLSAIYSMNTVDTLVNQLISIPGYIVPIDLDDDRQVSSLFLVPYFGACIHYPPPAPNQMIYLRLEHSIPMPDINLAYRVSGILSTALYEDLLGSSAYSLEILNMAPYSGQPDDFRQH